MKKQITVTIPQRVIMEIKASGLKKCAIARLLGIAPASLSQYFSGQYNLSDKRKATLAVILNKNPDWLFGKEYQK